MAAKPVVVAVDGSEGSLRAVEWAAADAVRRASPLRIVSVPAMPPRMQADDLPTPTVADELRDFSEQALATGLARARDIAPDLVIETHLLSGPPALAIAGSGAGALVLIVGARGIGEFAAMLLGSVSRYAATHSSCPVVVVRGDLAAVHGEIVAGVRDPHEAAEALAFAFEEAALRGAGLVAIQSSHGAPHAAAGQLPGQAEGSLSELLNGWRGKYPAVAVRQEVVREHPAQVLAEYSVRADLVVIGRHGGSRARTAVGSVQHALLSHAHGPVAVVPSES